MIKVLIYSEEDHDDTHQQGEQASGMQDGVFIDHLLVLIPDMRFSLRLNLHSCFRFGIQTISDLGSGLSLLFRFILRMSDCDAWSDLDSGRTFGCRLARGFSFGFRLRRRLRLRCSLKLWCRCKFGCRCSFRLRIGPRFQGLNQPLLCIQISDSGSDLGSGSVLTGHFAEIQNSSILTPRSCIQNTRSWIQ